MIPESFISPCASSQLSQLELDTVINKFGAFVTLLTNKPISCVTLFLIIQKHPELKHCLVDMSDTSWYSLVEHMAYRYPVLNKSKKIK